MNNDFFLLVTQNPQENVNDDIFVYSVIVVGIMKSSCHRVEWTTEQCRIKNDIKMMIRYKSFPVDIDFIWNIFTWKVKFDIVG